MLTLLIYTHTHLDLGFQEARLEWPGKSRQGLQSLEEGGIQMMDDDEVGGPVVQLIKV